MQFRFRGNRNYWRPLLSRLKRRKETRQAEIMPWPAAIPALEPHMSAALRQEGYEIWIVPPVISEITVGGNPGIVERVDHQGRYANAVEIVP